MSCMWCISFREVETFDPNRNQQPEELIGRPGQCTLNPTWVDVTGGHMCRHFIADIQNFSKSTSLIANWWLANRERDGRENEQRAEIRRLREANKALRAKLKAEKS